MTAEEFRLAEQKLLTLSVPRGVSTSTIAVSGIKRQPSLLDMMKMQSNKSTMNAASSTSERQTQTKYTVSNNNGGGLKRKISVLDMLKTGHKK